MNTMQHLHIDCFSGISGDMFLGALIDAGLPLSELKRELRKINVKGYQIKTSKVHRGTIHATKVDIHIRKGFSKPLSLSTIRRLISSSQLQPGVKARALEAFHQLGKAEATVHGVPPTKVHFHEVGVVDSFIDIVGAFVGCAHLDVEPISASPVNVGSGTIQAAHGTLPVPGPAVAEIGKGVPIFASGPPIELTTPTGMCILTTLTKSFQPLPPIRPKKIGYGAGTEDPKGWPNVLRIFLGPVSSMATGKTEPIIEIQTNVDDLNPQVYEALIERLFQTGACDVTLTPVVMKRGRPGTIITALAPHSAVEDVTRILFEETTTLGVRVRELQRRVLSRDTHSISLPGGPVRLKVADMGNGATKMMPEFQDCKKVADKTGRPVREILELARQAFHNQVSTKSIKRKTRKS